MSRKLFGAALAFGSGLAFGLALGWRKQVAGTVYVYKNMATVINEAKLYSVSLDPTGMGSIEVVKENLREDLEVQADLTVPYVETPINYGLIMITEEQYNSYEGDYDKHTIEVFKEDLLGITVLDGETVANWQELIGEDALEELAGQTSIYIRNHARNADYEVTWGRP